MLDALVMTLGFEPGPLVSAVASAAARGFSEGARIVVLTAAFPDERVERAWLQFQTVVGMMELCKRLSIEMEKREVPLGDMALAILNVKRIFEELAERSVRVSITGGMRALGLAVFIACLLTRWRREPEIEVYLEGRGAALEVPSVRRLLTAAEKCGDVVRIMRTGKVWKLNELAVRLGRDRSTVYRKMKLLREAGAVRKVRGGYELTVLGMLLS